MNAERKKKKDLWEWRVGRKGAWIELVKSDAVDAISVAGIKVTNMEHKKGEFSFGFVSRLQNS